MTTRDEWTSAIGEGLHTGFRKGVDHPKAQEAWQFINDMDPELWHGALCYLVWGLEEMDMIEVDDS